MTEITDIVGRYIGFFEIACVCFDMERTTRVCRVCTLLGVVFLAPPACSDKTVSRSTLSK